MMTANEARAKTIEGQQRLVQDDLDCAMEEIAKACSLGKRYVRIEVYNAPLLAAKLEALGYDVDFAPHDGDVVRISWGER